MTPRSPQHSLVMNTPGSLDILAANTLGSLYSPVVNTPCSWLKVRITQRIFGSIWNPSLAYLMGPGEVARWKKLLGGEVAGTKNSRDTAPLRDSLIGFGPMIFPQTTSTRLSFTAENFVRRSKLKSCKVVVTAHAFIIIFFMVMPK